MPVHDICRRRAVRTRVRLQAPECPRIHSTNSRYGNRIPNGPEMRIPHIAGRGTPESGVKLPEINGAEFGESA